MARAWRGIVRFVSWTAAHVMVLVKRLLGGLQALLERLLATEKIFENLASLTFLVVLLAVLGLLAARLLHRFEPSTQIIIGNFTTVGMDVKGSEATGGVVANLLSDSLDDVISEGATYKGNSYASDHQLFPPKTMPKIPVTRAFDFTVKGIAFSQVTGAWDALRYQQWRISGEILPASSDDLVSTPVSGALMAGLPSAVDRSGHWVIHARLVDDDTVTWTSGAFTVSQDSLHLAVHQLAEKIMTSQNPELAGRYFLNHNDYSEASSVFSQWLSAHPHDPEANVWLARSFAMDVKSPNLAAAQAFAQRALDNNGPEPRRWHREERRRYEEVNQFAWIVLGTVARNTGRPQEAADYFGKEADNPAAWLDKGELDSAVNHNAAAAENDYQKAFDIDPQHDYVGAMVNQAKVETDAKEYEKAEGSLAKAFEIDPFFPDAMETYVREQVDGQRSPGAGPYCAAWIDPMARGKMTNVATAKTYGLCAKAEAFGHPANMAKVVSYLTAFGKKSGLTLDEGPSLVREVVAKMCPVQASKAGMPGTVVVNGAGTTVVNLVVGGGTAADLSPLVGWLRAQKMDDQVQKCEGKASAGGNATGAKTGTPLDKMSTASKAKPVSR